MSKAPDHARLDRIVLEARQQRALRDDGYRERALKLYPWICGRCAREFSGVRLSELTVHHKDHNHDNNPPDGSNWELLCIYCHDMEHQRYVDEDDYGDESNADERDSSSSYRPFANLQELLKDKK